MNLRPLCTLFLLLAAALSAIAQRSAPAKSISQWARFEAAFTSDKPYEYALHDVRVIVRFTSPSGAEKEADAFWDGAPGASVSRPTRRGAGPIEAPPPMFSTPVSMNKPDPSVVFPSRERISCTSAELYGSALTATRLNMRTAPVLLAGRHDLGRAHVVGRSRLAHLP